MTDHARETSFIDLNADLGEGCHEAQLLTDAGLLQVVTSANIACGGHAGDASSMRRAIAAAIDHGVAVGAHPSYPDVPNFGRRRMEMTAQGLLATLRTQIDAIARVADQLGASVVHVKPHGALYHAAMMHEDVAETLARALRPGQAIIARAGAPAASWWRQTGLNVIEEVFADRKYTPDGTLQDRLHADAVVTNPAVVIRQAVSLATSGSLVLESGEILSLAADTICIHSDTPNAVPLAQAVRRALESAGVSVRRARTE